MRPLVFVPVIGLITICVSQSAFAQQSRRPVTIVFRQATVAKTQWSADAADATGTSGGMTDRSETGTPPGVLPEHSEQTAISNPLQTGSDNSTRNGAARPTLQQLQNPSGGYLLTHSNYSQGQYTSRNNYIGSQFNTWNNLRTQPQNLDQFESFNRTQPPTQWGGYASPNTYIGPANNQWSNLSTAYITPNSTGGWSYQP